MRISIALATYNGADHLREQLDSFTAQTQQPDEIVIRDDNSSDGTVDLLRSFAEAASCKVRIEHNPVNLGYAQNFSRTLAACTGDLIFPSDQDDVWLPGKLETMAEIADKESEGLLFMNDAEIADEDLEPTGLTKLGQIRASGMSDREFVMGCCMAIRGDFLRDLLPVPEGCRSHDSWITHIAIGLGRRRLVETPLQLYRLHGANTSRHLANLTTRAGRIAQLLRAAAARAGSDQIAILARYREETDAAIARLEGMRAAGRDYVADSEIERCLDSFSELRYSIAERIRILSRPRAARLAPVARMVARGGYRRFQGVKSAIADLLL